MVPGADTTPPACVLTAVGINSQTNQKYIQVRVQDTGSGLGQIQVTRASNMSVAVPTFQVGTTAPLTVVATRIVQTQSATLVLRVLDAAGNATTCDPVMTDLVVGADGRPALQPLADVSATDHYLLIQNDHQGLSSVEAIVNGYHFSVAGLTGDETRHADVASALRTSGNLVLLTGMGAPGASALVLFSDVDLTPSTPTEGAPALTPTATVSPTASHTPTRVPTVTPIPPPTRTPIPARMDAFWTPPTPVRVDARAVRPSVTQPRPTARSSSSAPLAPPVQPSSDAPTTMSSDPQASQLVDPSPPPAPALTLDFPRALTATSALLLAENVYADESGVLWQSRSWTDPADGSSWASLEELGLADQLLDTQLVVVNSHLWRVRSWRTPESNTWDETEDLGLLAPLPNAAATAD